MAALSWIAIFLELVHVHMKHTNAKCDLQDLCFCAFVKITLWAAAMTTSENNNLN